jgi:hypothetical protein
MVDVPLEACSLSASLREIIRFSDEKLICPRRSFSCLCRPPGIIARVDLRWVGALPPRGMRSVLFGVFLLPLRHGAGYPLWIRSAPFYPLCRNCFWIPLSPRG